MTPDDPHSERRDNGVDLLRTLTGLGASDEARDRAERIAEDIEERYGALGSFVVDHVFGTVWADDALNRRDRSLVAIALLATLEASDELEVHIVGALNHGLSATEVREVMLQVAAYAGFPRAMSAMQVVDAAVLGHHSDLGGLDPTERPPASQLDGAERHARGADVLNTLYGGRTPTDPTEARAGVVERLGPVGELAFDFAFGEIWARKELSRRDRSLITVAILGLLHSSEELAIHVPGALNHGASRTEIEAVIGQLSVYGGFPRAVAAMRAVRACFDRIDHYSSEEA